MKKLFFLLAFFTVPAFTMAGEANLIIPNGMKSDMLLYWGFLVTGLGMLFGLYQYNKVKRIKAHKSMLDVANVIYQTSKTYLLQQGKFLIALFVIKCVLI